MYRAYRQNDICNISSKCLGPEVNISHGEEGEGAEIRIMPWEGRVQIG